MQTAAAAVCHRGPHPQAGRPATPRRFDASPHGRIAGSFSLIPAKVRLGSRLCVNSFFAIVRYEAASPEAPQLPIPYEVMFWDPLSSLIWSFHTASVVRSHCAGISRQC